MDSFKFPPPPPPPPKQTTGLEFTQHGNVQRDYHSNHASRGGCDSYGSGAKGGVSNHRRMNGASRGQGGAHASHTRGFQSPAMGEKRKWSERKEHGRPPQGKYGSASHHQRQPTGVAPAVPSFGFSLPSQPTAPGPSTLASSTTQKDRAKRRNNQLGLTPKGPERVESDEETDEEIAFKAIQYPNSGALPNIKNRTELAAWIAERKKRFPTKARLEERQKVEREAELARLKEKVHASRKTRQGDDSRARTGNPKAKSTEDRQRARLEKHMRKAEELRQQLANRTTSNANVHSEETATKMKPSLLGSSYDSDDSDARQQGAISDSESSDGSLSESDTSSDMSSSGSSNNDLPEETSAKSMVPPSAPRTDHIPKERAEIPERFIPWVKRGFCKDYIQQRACRYGQRCKFKHKIPHELKDAKVPRTRLHDRLVAQEVQSENMAAVRAIHALGARGFFKDTPG